MKKGNTQQLTVVRNPAHGTVVLFQRSKNVIVPVYVHSGNWEVNGRISNFWYISTIRPDGTLRPEIGEYGSFFEANKKFKVNIVVK
jgi:hypothetical protein